MGEIIGYLLGPALFSLPVARLIKYIAKNYFDHATSYQNSYWTSFICSVATLLFLNIFVSISMKYKDIFYSLPFNENVIDAALTVFALILPSLLFYFIAFKTLPDLDSNKMTTKRALFFSITINLIYIVSTLIFMGAIFLFVK